MFVDLFHASNLALQGKGVFGECAVPPPKFENCNIRITRRSVRKTSTVPYEVMTMKKLIKALVEVFFNCSCVIYGQLKNTSIGKNTFCVSTQTVLIHDKIVLCEESKSAFLLLSLLE